MRTQNDSLRAELDQYFRLPGVRAAMLVSDQGLLISGVGREDVEMAHIAALVIDTITSAQNFGLRMQAGPIHAMTVDFESLTLVLAPFTSDVMLALLADPGTFSHQLPGTAHRPGQ